MHYLAVLDRLEISEEELSVAFGHHALTLEECNNGDNGDGIPTIQHYEEADAPLEWLESWAYLIKKALRMNDEERMFCHIYTILIVEYVVINTQWWFALVPKDLVRAYLSVVCCSISGSRGLERGWPGK